MYDSPTEEEENKLDQLDNSVKFYKTFNRKHQARLQAQQQWPTQATDNKQEAANR